MSALATYLQRASRLTPPTPLWAGLLLVGSVAPAASTSPYYLFYYNSATDKLYINPNRTAGSWIEIADAQALSDGGAILTATT